MHRGVVWIKQGKKNGWKHVFFPPLSFLLWNPENISCVKGEKEKQISWVTVVRESYQPHKRPRTLDFVVTDTVAAQLSPALYVCSLTPSNSVRGLCAPQVLCCVWGAQESGALRKSSCWIPASNQDWPESELSSACNAVRKQLLPLSLLLLLGSRRKP